MHILYRNWLRVFWRSKDGSIPYFTVLALLLAYWVFSFTNYLRHGDLFSALIGLVRPNLLLIALFMYCGYRLAVTLQDNHMVEYLTISKQGLARVYGSLILCQMTLVMVPFTMYLAFVLFLYRYADVRYPPLLTHLIKLCMLYCGLSFLIGGLLGITMAVRFQGRRLAAYGLTVVLVLLNTTFTDVPFRMPRLLFDAYATERMLYYFKDFVTLVPHEIGSTFEIPPIYGFPMEPIRWILAVVWVCFPLTLIASACSRRRRPRQAVLAASCAVLLVGVGLFSVRGSTLAMDRRVESFPYADPFYYMERPVDDTAGQEAGFSIEAYEMDLTISKELHAEVTITIDNPDLARYDFTLYHGYILSSVRTEHGEIPFTREGDYISIGSLNGADRVVFTYYGKSPKYYANAQAITLPGYFAYYPKAGRLDIWDRDRYGYVVNVSPNESHYTVKVRSNLKVFSNLAGSDNAFAGRANALSLFAGMYDEIDEGIYAEPARRDLPTRACVREAEELLAGIFAGLDRPQPEWILGLSKKKFFQVPRSIALNSNTEDVVVMSDHITAVSCSSGSDLARRIMESMLKPSQGADLLARRFLDYLFAAYGGGDVTSDPVPGPDRLLADIDELRRLRQEYAGITRDELLAMDEQQLEAYETHVRRERDLTDAVLDNAARYLFYDSPRKTANLQTFFDYFMSDSKEDYLDLIERALREEQTR